MPHRFEGTTVAPKGRFAVCVARFNAMITERLEHGAVQSLVRMGVADSDIDVYLCPGAFELPALVRRVATRGYAGVVAVGCVIQGETPHFEYVAGECSRGLAHVALGANCAIGFGVLTTADSAQAMERAGLKAGNKGADAAAACVEMATLFARLEK